MMNLKEKFDSKVKGVKDTFDVLSEKTRMRSCASRQIMVKEKDVVGVLNVLRNERIDGFVGSLSVIDDIYNCGWNDIPDMWSIWFRTTDDKYKVIIARLASLGEFKTRKRNDYTDLYIELGKKSK